MDRELDEYDGEPEAECQTCGGDGHVYGEDMDDPLWYDQGEIVKCPNCRGTGLGKDQTYW